MKFRRNLWIGIFALAAVAGVAQATSWTKTDQITSSSGTAVDFPAGFTNAEQTVGVGSSSAGVFAASTNVVAVSTAAVNYFVFGNFVHAWGETATTTTTASGTSSTFSIAVPVARTGGNFAASNGSSGRCGPNTASAAGVIVASQSGVVVNCTYPSTATGTTKVNFSFDYLLTP